ncbi:MAG: regulatory protein RecX [Eubacteriales bacterium]|jgi:SOS response regulatory protein OraA/RecX|nr:regulatory protein RecX [Eubacteriales bacterium]
MNTKNTERNDNTADGERERAIKAAVNILTYADNTETKLRGKLAVRKFSREAIDAAVAYVIGRGWLNEEKQAVAIIRYLADVKLFGRRRILQEMVKRGFRRSVIDGCDFDDIDFTENCRRLWEKRGYTEDEKTRAYLNRAGYSGDDIRAAKRLTKNTNGKA